MGRAAAALGFEIDEGAIERIARGARWQGALEFRPAEAAGHVFGEARDRRHDAGDGLAVAGIGYAFAAAADPAFGKLGDDHLGFGLRAAADGEGAGDRPALASHGEAGRSVGSWCISWCCQFVIADSP